MPSGIIALFEKNDNFYFVSQVSKSSNFDQNLMKLGHNIKYTCTKMFCAIFFAISGLC